MASALLQSLIATIIVSLIAVVVAIPFLLKKNISKKLLLVLLSISVGTLLSSVFIHFLPEAVSDGYTLGVAIYVLIGFLVFFIIEKLVHYHHNKCEHDEHPAGHSHAYHIAPLNIIGDGVHNFIDGMVIAGSFMASPALGIAATIAVIFHEVPQEIADFGVLLYSGLSKAKALLFNFLSAVTAIFGVVVSFLIAGAGLDFTAFILPFAAGNFLYIAASNLLPELHRHCKLKETLVHVLAIMFGILIMVAVALLGPGHVH